MQGGALGDSHVVAEKSSEAGLLVEPMEKPTGGGFTSLGLKTGGAPVRGLGGPWTSVRRPVGVQCGWTARGRTVRHLVGSRRPEALGGWTTHGSIAKLASRRSEVEKELVI